MHPNVRTTNRTSGSTFIATTDETTGEFVSIDIVTAAKFEVLTGNCAGLADETEGTAVEVPAGTTIDGLFTAIKLHSGKVIAYRK